MKIIQNPKYNIYYGDTSLNELAGWINKNNFTNIYVITDPNTNHYCLPIVNTFLPKNHNITIKEGEEHKSINSCKQLWNELIATGCDRFSLLINLGGGVVTDLGGFVAATIKRGISYINIPTTLMAMTDASIGSKTAINLAEIKNQIGLFNDPKAIFIYPGFLKTLPDKQLISGYAEMIKHALIKSNSYWNQLIAEDNLYTNNLIYQSINIKNNIVSKDKFEDGQRKLLNFGHTIGHALESCSHKHKKVLYHGEAILLGILGESYISMKKTGLPPYHLKEITKRIAAYMPKVQFRINDDEILQMITHDKKNKGNKFYFTLLEKIGKGLINIDVDRNLILEGLNYLRNISKKL